jgi:hypothetical protein
MGYQGETGYELQLRFIHSGVRMSIQWMVWLVCVCADWFQHSGKFFFEVANFLLNFDRKSMILTQFILWQNFLILDFKEKHWRWEYSVVYSVNFLYNKKGIFGHIFQSLDIS